MLVAVTGSAPAWRTALGELPIVRGGRWAVGGSASLALHGLPVYPRDLDLLVDHVAAAEVVDGLGGAVVSDEARWDRGDVRAVRRALAVVHGVEVEILEGVEAVGPTGDVVVATPDLDHVDRIIVSGRRIPVLPLSTIQVLFDATGNRERAAMVAKALEGRCQGTRFDSVWSHRSGQDITVSDIAAAAFATVHAVLAFRREVDITPMAYLRQVRLARARQELVAAEPGTQTPAASLTRSAIPGSTASGPAGSNPRKGDTTCGVA